MRRTVELGFLTDNDLSIFVRLIRNRRCLPVYRGGFWGCYECPFESADLQIIAAHIMCIHDPAPPSNEEELCEDTATSDTGASV